MPLWLSLSVSNMFFKTCNLSRLSRISNFFFFCDIYIYLILFKTWPGSSLWLACRDLYTVDTLLPIGTWCQFTSYCTQIYIQAALEEIRSRIYDTYASDVAATQGGMEKIIGTRRGEDIPVMHIWLQRSEP